MLKFEEICELIRLVGAAEIASVEIEHAGGRVRIEGVARNLVTPTVAVGPDSLPVVPAPIVPERGGSAGGGQAAPEEEEEERHLVTSPIVGTFYRAPNPDADPYVKVGDFVEKGQVLCIVEAMKLMNEIESDTSGTIVKVFPQNAEPVEFGASLFAVRPG